jgi:hypothetical protein
VDAVYGPASTADSGGARVEKAERHTLARVYADPVTPGTRWKDVEHLFIGLGGYARWSDDHHLTVELHGHKRSFQTPRDKNSDLDANDGKQVRGFLATAGVTADMAQG